MEETPKTKIYKMIRELKIVPDKRRQEFLCEIVEGIIKSRSVLFSEIADKIDKSIKISSIERQIQDFFLKVTFDYTNLILFFLSFIHHKKLILSVDRTEWDFGKTQINILCIVASIGKMGVPLYFEMLDNKSGNSNYQDRIDLLTNLIDKIGKDRILMLVMDREFIGYKWLSWLKSEAIEFCVRVPKHHKITFQDGQCRTAKEVLGAKKRRYLKNVFVDTVRVNVSIFRDTNGELLYLVGTVNASKLASWYRKRWAIEVIFQALKNRGFNLEKSCLKNIGKYRKLFALVCIAYTICWAAGIENGRTNPVKIKKHGYPQYSVFRRGLNLIRQFFKDNITQPIISTFDRAELKLALFLKSIG